MSDKYQTDEWLMKLFTTGTWWDPCPINWNKALHACSLSIEWDAAEKIFINPPYSNPKPWVEKAIETSKKYGTLIVMLLKHDSSTEWYRLLHEYEGTHFLMVNGRLKHQTGKSAAFPSMLVIM